MWWMFFVGLGAALVGPVAYWLVGRGFNVSKTLRVATAASAVLMLIPLAALALLIMWLLGAFWAVVLLAGFFLFQYLAGPRLVLSGNYVRRPGPGEEWLVKAFDEVKGAANFRKSVDLYVARNPIPNAFAVSNLFTRAVVVHEGLLKLVEIGVLDKEDVKAVLAHELGHIVHRDNAYAIALSTTPYLTYVAGLGSFVVGVAWLKFAFEEDANPLPGVVLAVAGVVLLALSFLVNVGLLGFLRMREHLADIFAVRVTRSTKIAEALVKLETTLETLQEMGILKGGSPRNALKPDVRRMLYIVPMAYAELFGFVSYLGWASPLSTHPSTEARYFVVDRYYRQLNK